MSERKLKDKLQIKDMISAGIEITDFIDTDEVPMKLNWEILIRLCNAMIVQGEPISKNSDVADAMEVFNAAMKRAFL